MATQAKHFDKFIFRASEWLSEGITEVEVQDRLQDFGVSFTKTEDIILAAYRKNAEKQSQEENNTMNMAKLKNENIIADILSQVLIVGIVYGVPVFLLLFGLAYVYNGMVTDMSQGIRSLAAAILPLLGTLAIYKSDMREGTLSFFAHNKLVSFGVSFVLAMISIGVFDFLRDTQFNMIPIGELIFSATLAMLVFGTDNTRGVSFLHIGAVTGFLSYIILFGI